MSPNQVIQHYGSEEVASQALKVTRQCVNYWKKSNRIPMKTQVWIQFLSGNKLKADRNGK